MKALLLLSGIAILASCQNTPKKSAASDSTQMPEAVASPPVGYYEASLPAASSPGRLIGLTLKSTHDAEMTTDYMNSTPEVLQIGNWSAQEGGKYLVTLITVGSGNPAKDSLTFKKAENGLVYTGTEYGSDGLTLIKKEKPAPAAKELIIWVKSEAECDRGPGFGKTKCYEVIYGDKLMEPWEKLSEPIDGFRFEKGNRYKLKVNRIPRDPRIQDVGAYEYKLIEVLSKEQAK